MTNLEKNSIRLLIDIFRDRLPKSQNKNYSMILRSINILAPIDISKEEMKQADEKFRSKMLLNIWHQKRELETLKDESSDMNSFAKEIERRRKEQEEQNNQIENFVKSYLEEKFKYMK